MKSKLLLIGSLFISAGIVFAEGDQGWGPTSASNVGSIVNSRHNLTQSFNAFQETMNVARNDYRDVCVYCHTPHGTSSVVGAPLWNRTKSSGAFDVYSRPTTLSQTISQPGTASLTCLSCHDGTTAIDSIINMPGSGGYNKAQETTVSDAFLDTWNNTGPDTNTHGTLNDCRQCHNALGPIVPNFDVFVIGKDLNNDHPVGVQYPTSFGTGVDFRAPTRAEAGRWAYFDNNGNSRADKNEIRMYGTDGIYEVECASCHDPHGVPSAGPESTFVPSFLRVSNAGSALCLTCHDK